MKEKVIILGGGVTGLTSAWALARSNPNSQVVLLESQSTPGGWIQSVRRPDGAVHEIGPRSMRFRYRAGKRALAMMYDLGLQSQVLPIGPNHKAANRRLIYTDKHGLVDLPSSIWGILRPRPPFTSQLTAAILKEPFNTTKQPEGSDESVRDFIVRRFGNEVADWLIDPMCRGIFAGSSSNLSLQSTFGILANYERSHGSVIKGGIFTNPEPSGVEDNPLVERGRKERWQIYALRGGIHTLIESLVTAASSAGVDVCMDTEVTGISFEKEGKVKVSTAHSGDYTCDHVISTLPARVIASILPDQCSQLSHTLNSISSVTVGVVNLQYKGHVLPEQYREAFGYLVPSHQQSKVLGVVFDSSTFPELDTQEHSSTRLTVMMGGHWFDELFGDPNTVSSDTLVEEALHSLYYQTKMGSVDPEHVIVNVLKDCIPQYTLGHSDRIGNIYHYIQSMKLPLTLLGSSYGGVSVNDCIMSGLDVAERL